MKKIALYIALILGTITLGACQGQITKPQKPTRDSGEAQARASWVRPQSWEGGLPGMSTNAPNQY
ncbi:MAG: hypothetical protein J6P03_00370 [Opitutales bacterium]|nr:hypothetical protein [Opitutales bacterium]